MPPWSYFGTSPRKHLVKRLETIRPQTLRNLLLLWMTSYGEWIFEDPRYRERTRRGNRNFPLPSLREIIEWFHCSRRTAQDYLSALIVLRDSPDLMNYMVERWWEGRLYRTKCPKCRKVVTSVTHDWCGAKLDVKVSRASRSHKGRLARA